MATKAAAKGGKAKAATKGKASKPGRKAGELERDLREAKDALKERSDQLAETARLLEVSRRDLAAAQEKARAAEAKASATDPSSGGAIGKIRCPRCSGPMTEYDHTVVRADRCDNCHGIFFDNGELEQVVEKALKDHDGQTQGGWFSSLFGRREKGKTR